MSTPKINILIACIFTFFISACTGANIGLKTDYKSANFQVGKTSRADVIAYLGLPQKSLKDPDGQLHLLYERSSKLTGLCGGSKCGGLSGQLGGVEALISDAANRDGAEYVFDTNGILIRKSEADEPNK
jgi:hypothetical protein